MRYISLLIRHTNKTYDTKMIMEIEYPERENLFQTLKQTPSNSVEVIVLVTSALNPENYSMIKTYLEESIRALKNSGLLFVQGRPDYLPELGVFLDKHLTFKYWIAIKSTLQRPTVGLPSVHAAILLFTKGNGRFNLNRVRFPHEYCAYCGKPLRDWGGKTHLMNPEGYAISDVWTSLPSMDNYTQLSEPVLNTILKMANVESPRQENVTLPGEFAYSATMQKRVIIGPKEGIESLRRSIAEPAIQYHLPGFGPEVAHLTITQPLEQGFWNVVHHGDVLEILKQYPSNSVDLVFADPPYNLDKAYNVYDDELEREAYLNWCNAWLQEYIRILKPTGALYLLNLPRWTMYHAAFLNQYLYFQNWIVWDALSEPRGKLMPAHYGLLFYTKHPTNFIFNYDQVKEIEPRHYCLRSSCIRKRKIDGVDDKEILTDIWIDIHRLKHRRDRDYHPCQLPDLLMERIIRLSTVEGGIVLDALAGTGTTAVAAYRLGRRYVAIDIDEAYVHITKEKLFQVEQQGYVHRDSIHRKRPQYSKKALQMELQEIATKLGRLPTPDDVRAMSSYSLDAFLETFPTWGKALKAAKLEINRNGNRST
jgi:site-specific DNA-methyltransferase (adenine-specific)